ncbi:MAG: cation-transporting P-type ATPase [Reichenbachiella sp.]|uniref:cation-translocating P-type ATPase n=1 Tax=Reichenbachiella sp. TaxID=2184521 RepID=UPI00326684CA
MMLNTTPVKQNPILELSPAQMKGLSSLEAADLLKLHGKNEIERTIKIKPWKILIRQFKSPLIIILIIAAAISFLVGYLPGQDQHIIDTVLILIIVSISGTMGFIQDYNAEKTIEALQKLDMPKSVVVRNGESIEIDSKEIVPGDLLSITAGDMISADGIIISAFHLEIDESILTGESVAVKKIKDSEVFKNSVTTAGHAMVKVTATGMKTRIGHIADRLQRVEVEQSNFQKELNLLSKKLSIITILITLVIAAVGMFKFGFYTSLLTAISLAVAAIPEGLPAVMVLALALGAGRMFKKNALIRKLPIVESVGAVDIICTDKTGTLTLNEMTVTKLYFDGQEYTIDDLVAIKSNETFGKLLTCGSVCNNATVNSAPDREKLFIGDQTEIALLKAAFDHLDDHQDTLDSWQKIDEVPFSSERKMMSVLVKGADGSQQVFSKGAPEMLINRCTRILENGKEVDLTEKMKEELLLQNQSFAAQSLRVLGFAYNPSRSDESAMESDLVWIGLQAMIDPPRDEVKGAIEDCLNAGIKIIIITGDNAVTTNAIAKQIGLMSAGVIEGSDMDEMSDDELESKIKSGVNIFARTDPFHKLRLLEILEENHTVAMTGDGVNDALAIKRAVVGISMGKKGTEVAKQASDIVLLDDNFSTIRDAVKEGRTIFNNIRKFIDYLLTCNLAEVGIIFFITIFFSFDEPIMYPVQLLWINLLTDGLVALALGADPPAKDIMSHPPRKNDEPLINKKLGWLIGLIGAKKAILLVGIFLIVLPSGLDLARSTLITGIVLFEFVRIGAIRYGEALGWFANKWLVAGLITSIVLHLLIVYTSLNQYFYLVPLGQFEWLVLIGGLLLGYTLAILITKLVSTHIRTESKLADI